MTRLSPITHEYARPDLLARSSPTQRADRVAGKVSALEDVLARESSGRKAALFATGWLLTGLTYVRSQPADVSFSIDSLPVAASR